MIFGYSTQIIIINFIQHFDYFTTNVITAIRDETFIIHLVLYPKIIGAFELLNLITPTKDVIILEILL